MTNRKEIQRHKRNYENNIRWSQLSKDDIVQVKRETFQGKHKIQDRWKNKPYVVMEKSYDDLPLYKVKPCQEDGKERAIHSNELFPLLNA